MDWENRKKFLPTVLTIQQVRAFWDCLKPNRNLYLSNKIKYNGCMVKNVVNKGLVAVGSSLDFNGKDAVERKWVWE